jgi:hypothetical protein
VDVIIGFLVICVLPFAWILKDGLGPDSVPTKGFEALSRIFMTFYVGPAILLFVSFDLLLRRAGNPDRKSSPGATMVTWLAAIAAILALSMVLVHAVFRP